MKNYICDNCLQSHKFAVPIVGKCSAVGISTIAATKIKNPLLALLVIGTGLWVGHQLDESVLPTCPECGLFLRLVAGGLS